MWKLISGLLALPVLLVLAVLAAIVWLALGYSVEFAPVSFPTI